ncbi:DNA-binding transcriptional repressor AcrR [Lacticaseibacillus paracasei]|uniref:TetR/AcrR family transcriptional regulator n=1 Tax=Lacticaseibacillus paracasei TaxID=1597 RepID=UPI000F0B7C03|nr:TetR/AcrR family transcriptional regulator [Lacticaseibacillus paracasei]RND88526.1 DNA-binding transcriptional repressor AcrR [Lacticaseibacillus paracasei]
MATNAKMVETEIKIQKAFIQLLQQEGFGKLSVQQLVKLASISRGTFYLHYFDKYDLLNHYEDEIVSHVNSIFERFPKPMMQNRRGKTTHENDAFFQLFKYLYRQRELAALLLNESSTQLIGKVKQLIVAVLRQGDGDAANNSGQVPSEYAQEIVSQGVLDIIVYWLNQNPVLSPEEAYHIFRQTRLLTPEQLTRQIK